MYQYQIKKGEEHRIFAGDNVRNLGNGIVESDHPLTSPYLTPIEEQPAPANPAPAASQSQPQQSNSAQPTTPQSPNNGALPAQNEQTANKEASN